MAEVDYIEAALQQLLQERAELDTAIAALEKRRGKGLVTVSNVSQAAKTQQPVGGETVVYRGEFFKLSVTKATEKLLRRAGRPLKTPEILAAFQRAEFEIKAKNPRPTIYTSLNRSKDFVKVAPDTWDLSEKYPEAAAQKEQEMHATKTAKARTSRRPRGNVRRARVRDDAMPEGLKTVA